MQHIGDLLDNTSPKEPFQVTKLKRFASDRYGFSPRIIVTSRSYTLIAPNAALAHKIRVDGLEINDKCKLDKPLNIRIASA